MIASDPSTWIAFLETNGGDDVEMLSRHSGSSADLLHGCLLPGGAPHSSPPIYQLSQSLTRITGSKLTHRNRSLRNIDRIVRPKDPQTSIGLGLDL
jgi:hypothetical protein